MFAVVSALLLSQAPGIQAGRLLNEDGSALPHSRRLHVSKVAPPPAPPAGDCGGGGQPVCSGDAMADREFECDYGFIGGADDLCVPWLPMDEPGAAPSGPCGGGGQPVCRGSALAARDPMYECDQGFVGGAGGLCVPYADMEKPVAPEPVEIHPKEAPVVEATPEETGGAPGAGGPDPMPRAGAPMPAGGDCKSPFDLVAGQPDLSTLGTLVEAAGLTKTLGDAEGSYTVLAPSDAAFAKFPQADLDALAAHEEALNVILGLHVIPGTFKAADLTEGEEVETLAGKKLTVSVADGVITFTAPDMGLAATVTEGDIMACGNVLHQIDHVLIPGVPEKLDEVMAPAMAPGAAPVIPEAPVEATAEKEAAAPASGGPGPMPAPGDCKSPLDLVAGQPDLSVLADTIASAPEVAASLGDADGAYTVLAPNDAAFALIPSADLDNLLALEPALNSILGLHVIPGTVKAADLTDGQKVQTLADYKLTVSVADGKVTFTPPDGGVASTVVEADIMACGNVLHKINHILVPGAPEDMMKAMAPAPAPVSTPVSQPPAQPPVAARPQSGEAGEYSICIQGASETFGPIEGVNNARRGEGVTITSDGKCTWEPHAGGFDGFAVPGIDDGHEKGMDEAIKQMFPGDKAKQEAFLKDMLGAVDLVNLDYNAAGKKRAEAGGVRQANIDKLSASCSNLITISC